MTTEEEFASCFADNLRTIMIERELSAGDLGLLIWSKAEPELERRQAGDRIKQTLDGHWPRPARVVELANALGVDPGEFYQR